MRTGVNIISVSAIIVQTFYEKQKRVYKNLNETQVSDNKVLWKM